MTKNKHKEFKPLTEKEIGATKADINCAEYRGKIIHYMIELESTTEEIILKYYFKNSGKKGREFLFSVMGKEAFSLNSKYMALKFILHHKYPQYLKEHSYLLPAFHELIELRNSYAHSKLFPISHDVLLLHQHTTKDNKMTIKQLDLSKEALELFYGKFKVVYEDLNEILLMIVKEVE